MQSEEKIKELKGYQNDEIEALKAIFMDDFQEVVNKTAWKVHSTQPHYNSKY